MSTATDRTVNGIPWSVVADAVRDVEADEGLCHPHRLVDLARHEDSPLHEGFEWDDTVAGEKWRTEQARHMIRTVRVIDARGQIDPAPQFVHVRIEEAGVPVREGYASWSSVRESPARVGVVSDALSALRGLERRYKALAELSEVWDALDRVDPPE